MPEVSRQAIDQIFSELQGLRKSNERLEDANLRAENSRKELHRQVAELVTTSALANQTLVRITPLVDKHEAAHNRMKGMVPLASVLSAFIASIATYWVQLRMK